MARTHNLGVVLRAHMRRERTPTWRACVAGSALVSSVAYSNASEHTHRHAALQPTSICVQPTCVSPPHTHPLPACSGAQFFGGLYPTRPPLLCVRLSVDTSLSVWAAIACTMGSTQRTGPSALCHGLRRTGCSTGCKRAVVWRCRLQIMLQCNVRRMRAMRQSLCIHGNGGVATTGVAPPLAAVPTSLSADHAVGTSVCRSRSLHACLRRQYNTNFPSSTL